VNEISFNAVALKELKMLALLRRVANAGEAALCARMCMLMRVHVVRNNVMVKLGYSSKLNGGRASLSMLRDEGRRAAGEFIAGHSDAIGRHSTPDFDALLDGV
jgi:NTE family protein